MIKVREERIFNQEIMYIYEPSRVDGVAEVLAAPYYSSADFHVKKYVVEPVYGRVAIVFEDDFYRPEFHGRARWLQPIVGMAGNPFTLAGDYVPYVVYRHRSLDVAAEIARFIDVVEEMPMIRDDRNHTVFTVAAATMTRATCVGLDLIASMVGGELLLDVIGGDGGSGDTLTAILQALVYKAWLLKRKGAAAPSMGTYFCPLYAEGAKAYEIDVLGEEPRIILRNFRCGNLTGSYAIGRAVYGRFFIGGNIPSITSRRDREKTVQRVRGLGEALNTRGRDLVYFVTGKTSLLDMYMLASASSASSAGVHLLATPHSMRNMLHMLLRTGGRIVDGKVWMRIGEAELEAKLYLAPYADVRVAKAVADRIGGVLVNRKVLQA